MSEATGPLGGQDATDSASRRAFLGMVVHELRGPLTVALGQSELLAESGDAFDAQTRATMTHDVHASVLRIVATVDDLATLAAADAKGLPISLAPESLADAMHEALDAGNATESDADAQLVEALAAAPPVLCDRPLLVRILRELIGYGRRSDPGGTVALATVVAPDAVTLEIVDRGPVLPTDERPSALDRLGRQKPGRRSRRVHPLGLTVARVLAEAQGGSVEIDDPRGGIPGCLVRLRIPRSPHVD